MSTFLRYGLYTLGYVFTVLLIGIVCAVATLLVLLYLTNDAEAANAVSTIDQEIASRVAAGEARGEGDDMAIAAVCHVMVNRLQGGRYGKSLHRVVTAKWQFSSLNANDPNRKVILASGYTKTRSYRRVNSICRTTVQMRLRGVFRDITGGADHYHSGSSRGIKWADQRYLTTRIGSFSFYRLGRSRTASLQQSGDAIAALIRELTQ